MKFNKKVLMSWIIILSLFLWTVVDLVPAGKAQAAGSLWDMQEGQREIGAKFGQSGTTPPDVRTVAANIVTVFLGFLGLIFLILIILAGFKWMTAGGNENKIDEAKSQIKNAAIGIVIVIGAYIIVSFVANRLLISGPGYMYGGDCPPGQTRDDWGACI